MARRYPLIGAALFFIMTSSGWAEEVFVTAPNGKIVAIDFETGDARTVVRDNGTNFEGLAAWGNGDGLRLVAANETRGGDLRLYDPVSGAGARIASFRGAHGVAVNLDGEVFAVNESEKNAAVLFIPRKGGCSASVSGPFAPGCGPGGYESPAYIDSSVKVNGKRMEELADVRFLRSAVAGLGSPGQLLVLVEEPARVLVYTEPVEGWSACDGSCEPETVATLGHYEPTGLDVTGDAILVTTEQGVVLEVTSAGYRQLVNLGGRGAKIAVGALDDQQVAYATVSNKGGKLYRFFTDGSDLQSVPAKVPEGVTSESSTMVALGSGENVEVLLPTMAATFDQIRNKGLIDANCALYPMPQPRPVPLTLGDLGITEDPQVVIPENIVPFRVGNEDSGPLSFFLCRVDTSALFRKTVEIHEDERRFLGYDPDCNTDNSATGVTRQARFFWAPSAGEQNAEGDLFIDISAGCGSNVGRGMKFSWILPAARDTRSVCEIVDYKLTGLAGTLENFEEADAIAGACIGDANDDGPVPPAVFGRVGDRADWAFVGATEGTFGEMGNDFLRGGGTTTFVYKEAAWTHRFGITDATGDVTLIADSAHPGSPSDFTVSGPFTFFFENVTGNAGRAQSNGTNSGSASMAVYRNLHDPGLFAFFYDDGGGAPDSDYNDFIVTVAGAAGTLCALKTTVVEAKEALGDVASCPASSDLPGVVDALTELTEIVDTHLGDIDDTDENRSGELDARAESGIFMTCKLTDCPSTTSGGHPHP